MVDGPRRSRIINVLNPEGRASLEVTPASRKRSNNDEASAAIFSLTLFQEKYAESLAFVSPFEFRCWWVASVVLHVGCAIFLVQVGRLYLYLPTKPVMWFFELYAVAIDTSNFKSIAITYFCAAGIHFLMLVTILTPSVRQRRIAFRAVPPNAAPASAAAPPTPVVGFVQVAPSQGDIGCRPASKTCQTTWKLLNRYLTPLIRVVLAVHEAFDIRSKYYGVTWVAVEVAQTLLQTYQAYRLSALMPRLWMTNVVVALIVLNCWAVSIVSRFICSDATHARLYVLALSLSLDLVSYILVPVLVFLPYQSQYNNEVGDFGDVYWYDDVWLVRMINELRLLFIVSLVDGASKAMMALSVPRSLYVLTKLLRERPAKLVGLKIRNSTIINWNKTAALTHAQHPELRFLFLGEVNMSTMPEGMVARDFPRRLRDIEMCRVNLTELPEELAEIWPNDMFLLIEQFQFSEFPQVVLKLRANLLSLAFNNFTEVPSALLAMPYTETLILNGNPLVTLPSSNDLSGNESGGDSATVEVGDSDDVFPSEKMLELHLVMTDVETLPSKWSKPGEFLSRALVNAPHTPLCTKLQESEGSEAAVQMFSGSTTGAGIDCFDDLRLTWYPINNP